ncbi:MAG: hypothetical protein U0L16_11145 [Phocaeicola sp.]|nr:hypothetical protein [Phocaeicola sp.]
MKTKSLLLAFAGLGLFACSNGDVMDNNQLPEGVGAVTINIQSPAMSRAVETGTTASTVPVKGNVTISLTASTGSGSIELTADEFGKQKSVTFWNVENPQKITVSMNGGKASYTSDAPTVFTGAPAGVPAYGETEEFTLTGNTASPGDKGGADYEIGANSGDNNKTYQLYSASVQLAIPVARLEVSGIQHVITGEHEVGTENGNCAYKKLTIAGVYLDNVYATGAGVTYANGAFPCATGAPTDYSYDGTNGAGDPAILKDKVTTVTDFLTANQRWPETANQAYAYYFYGADGADNLPKFKIYFSESESQNSASPLPAPRYAMITSYKQTKENGGTPITKFEPGHIYRITSAKLTDENIIGDESGNTLYGIEVTVTEAEWTMETIDADWAK